MHPDTWRNQRIEGVSFSRSNMACRFEMQRSGGSHPETICPCGMQCMHFRGLCVASASDRPRRSSQQFLESFVSFLVSPIAVAEVVVHSSSSVFGTMAPKRRASRRKASAKKGGKRKAARRSAKRSAKKGGKKRRSRRRSSKKGGDDA